MLDIECDRVKQHMSLPPNFPLRRGGPRKSSQTSSSQHSGSRLKPIGFISLARLALGNFFGDWVNARHRLTTCVVQS